LDNLLFPIYLRGLSPDLVHIPLNRVPLLMIQPYVLTVDDLANLFFVVEEYTRIRMQLRRARLIRGLVRASRVIAVSEATRRDVEKLAGVAPHRLRVVYNAPDPGFLAADGADAREERRRIMERYQIGYPFLLYAGNIRRHKNVPRLVEAFTVVREQLASHPVYRDLHLVIIGDTLSQFPAVRQTVIRSRVEHMVRFLGFVPFETLCCFYQSAAAFVFPSRYEGFGLPPLEAMACGAPVVTSNVSSLPEVVGDAAVLVNPENVFDIVRGIRDVLLDEPLRAALILRGREQASRFSWSRTAREVLEIYQEAAGRGD
jgi:glycosyltransferase involved in cell wall biosynthesis